MDNEQENKERIILELERKAEVVLSRIGEYKRPVFIEFCGTPKAGKTTTLSSLDLFLRRNGFSVQVVRERASVCPITKKNHMSFNIWTSLSTLNNVLELSDSSNDVVLIDRGIFDAIIWFYWMLNTGRLTEEEFKKIEQFICMKRWIQLIDIVFTLKVEYQVANDREFKDLLTSKEGSIMNASVISQYNVAIEQARERVGDAFKHIDCIDTTKSTLAETGEKITYKTLEVLESSLDEKILAVPRNVLKENSMLNGFVECKNKDDFYRIVKEEGKFIPRSKVEEMEDVIQIIPIGILEYEDQLLLLRRKEVDRTNRLNEKYVIWAGGHIREEDGLDNTVVAGLKREIEEELFIKNRYSIDAPLGFVYFDGHAKSRKHLGVIYKIKLSDKGVALGLDQAEFKERRGKSVSGTFQSLKQLSEFYSGMEQWSKMILTEHYNFELSPSSPQGKLDL